MKRILQNFFQEALLPADVCYLYRHQLSSGMRWVSIAKVGPRLQELVNVIRGLAAGIETMVEIGVKE